MHGLPATGEAGGARFGGVGGWVFRRLACGLVCGRWQVLLLLFLVLVGGASIGAWAEGASRRSARLTILHSNDLHGHVYPGVRGDPAVGGIARVAGYAQAVRSAAAATGAGVVLVDSGDVFSGTPEGGLTRGLVPVSAMCQAGYELACVGNHEFDLGVGRFAELAAVAGFPFLGANVVDDRTGLMPPSLKEFVVLDLAGVRVGFVGVLGTDSDPVSNALGRVRSGADERALRAGAEAARAAGAQVCVGLTHVGLDRDKELAGRLKEYGVLIGSHSHSVLPVGWRHAETGVWVVQAGCNGEWLGRVDMTLELEGATVVAVECKPSLVRLDGRIAEATNVVEFLANSCGELRRKMGEVVGELAGSLSKGGSAYAGESSPLGNFVTDVMRAAAGAEIALQNRTGLRADLPAGPVTRGQVYEACPYDNTIVAMDLAGSNVVALLDRALSGKSRDLLELSGGEVKYDPTAEEGSRIQALRIGGAAVEPGRTYRLATCSFLAQGGDGHVVFLRGTRFVDTGRILRDALCDALAQDSPWKVEYRNRIVK